ncbi:alpha-glucan family phosphorylase, partial [bacterium]|nr:alpha-glucan family phosphorylase [bacterium]
ESPIHSVKNGIHARSWISEEMESLFSRYLSPKWQENPTDKDFWSAVNNISLEELWRVKERQRQRLVSFGRKRLMAQLRNRGESETSVEAARDVLDMGTLTIGFARRFATYKRANLLFRDPERLRAILTNPDYPVQIIFAGKAHPRDDGGKKLIREIVHFARDEEIRSKLVFLEDYDINVARHMVQGVDVWLNTPRRPLEASGTSGMKAAVNGGLNCSTLDGWWADVYESGIGWAIGHGEQYEEEEYQDKVESEIMYDLLEQEIVRLFYDRDRIGVPRDWVRTIQNSLEKVCPIYFTTRMVEKYMRDLYLPCFHRNQRMVSDEYQHARDLAGWRNKVSASWGDVRIIGVKTNGRMDMQVGEQLDISVDVHLGDLSPDDVQVQVVFGTLGGDRSVADPRTVNLEKQSVTEDGKASYEGMLTLESTGNIGYAARVLPYHEDIPEPLMQGLVVWE